MKKISFCIPCMNRFSQISRTLGVNLEQNRAHEKTIEFVLVDCGSKDGLQQWVLSTFREELDKGYLKYYYTSKMVAWHASIAKNTAHYYAKGEFLVNLDCDNFTGFEGGAYVYGQFIKYGPDMLLHQFNGKWVAGTYGRIGMHRKFFFGVGGYDETFESMGHQDSDLLDRLFALGLRYKRLPDPLYNKAILNTKEDSVRYSKSTLTWNQMDLKNQQTSKVNVYTGRIIANEGVFGIRDAILTYEKGKMIPVFTDHK
jgi:glycosyltransferase involved in cell wall biosynthesis